MDTQKHAFFRRFLPVFTLLGLALAASPAAAQRDFRGEAPRTASSANEVVQPGEVPTDDDVSLETATPDPTPRVPTPLQRRELEVDVIEQAGVGGPVAYASGGVLEVGGMGSLAFGEEFWQLRMAPFVGWFIADGFELTYLHEVSGARIAGENRVATSMYLEPSGHVRVTDRLLAFAGVAPGVLYNGDDWGFTIRTRAGVDVLVGRSGIFRPALTFTWATRDLYGTTGTQLPGMRRVGGLEISYAAMF
ncbi:MAG: hypothetical protein H6724_02255 [Sandaracinus sp.]|nr:hypothetical protein [Sandaracinus sp.]MCB9618256.1 hypothetical protein [Sandaracinus sp.]